MDDLGFESWEGQKVFLFSLDQIVQNEYGTIQHSVHLVLEFFLEIKKPELDVNHPPASAKVKNEWSYTSTFPYTFVAWTGAPLSPRRVQFYQTNA
jgi:hypothetical protein